MDSDSWIQLILLILLIVGAAYFAASEISFASVNKIRLRNYADNGDKRAKKAMYITNNFERALSTILIGNNIMHIGFASLVTLLSIRLWGVESVKYTTIVATVIVFLVSEMIPKSYGKANNVKVAMAVSNSLYSMIKLFTPITYFFTLVSSSLSKVFPEVKEPEITEEEFYDFIEKANEEGILGRNKQELIESALDFDDIIIGDIYTKREDIVALDIDLNEEEILRLIKTQNYSRLPVYKNSIDNIIGILPVRKFLKQYIKYNEFDIKNLILEPHFMVKGAPIDNMLKQMSNKKLHMSIVNDDSGKTIGIVTLEDILEELVGEIWDEDDIVNADFAKLGGDRYEVNANLVVSDVFLRLGYQYLGNDIDYGAKKISQWVKDHLHDNPCEGDSFYEQNLEISVNKIVDDKIITVIFRLL